MGYDVTSGTGFDCGVGFVNFLAKVLLNISVFSELSEVSATSHRYKTLDMFDVLS